MMSVRTTLAAAATTAVALTTVALAPTAEAAQVTAQASYSCNIPGVGNATFQGSFSFASPSTVYAGSRVSSRKVTVRVTVPSNVASAAKIFASSVSGKITNAAVTLGSTRVPVGAITFPATSLNSSPVVMTGSGTISAFTAPGAGSYVLSLPKSFSLAVAAGGYSGSTTCSLSSDGHISNVPVLASTPSATTATVIGKPHVRGTKISVGVVVGGSVPGAGKVVARVKGHKVGSATVSGGAATLKLKRLKPGKVTVVITYTGPQGVAPSVKRLKLRVR